MKLRRAATLPRVSSPNATPIAGAVAALLLTLLATSPAPTTDILLQRLGPPAIDDYGVCRSFLEGVAPTIVSIVVGENAAELLVDGDPAEIKHFNANVLEHAIRNNPALDYKNIFAYASLFVIADQDIRYGDIVEVVSRLREDGFARVGLLNAEPDTHRCDIPRDDQWWPSPA